jgi:hypothetical protein
MRAEVAVLVDVRLTDAAINVSTAGPPGRTAKNSTRDSPTTIKFALTRIPDEQP